ncbi:DUF937 domain-containing protein [Methylocapsa acidiphila]|uniref:DUF937 domain-containing protein n=1 Tax=Methylocapsa acidiphila TaxID=133552 RepID=UPI0003FA6936|nr:DUF937 domain-containing protein [Methylocapsa acidiphila]
MPNLYEILQDAHGGQAIEDLAVQFNISPQEADAAVAALLPELADGLKAKAAEPEALAPVIESFSHSQPVAAFADPAAEQAFAAEKGGAALRQLFGSEQIDAQAIQRAAAATGLKPDLLAQILPILASAVFSGLTKALQNQGLGAIFSQIVNAGRQGQSSQGSILDGRGEAPSPASVGGAGGLGSILGQLLRGGSAQAGSSPASGGAFGGVLGTLLGALVGRAGGAPAAPAPSSSSPGLDANSVQAALEALAKMLQPGTQPPTNPAFRASAIDPAESEDILPEEPAPRREVEPEIRKEIGEILNPKTD